MKKFVFISSMLFGICFLAIQCRQPDDVIEGEHELSGGGGSSDMVYAIDSFSIWLSHGSSNEELTFDSVYMGPVPTASNLVFNVDFERLKYVSQSKRRRIYGFEVMATPRPQYRLDLSKLQITSDKDVETSDSLITAGSDLSSLFLYADINSRNTWNNDIFFLSDSSPGYELGGFLMKLGADLKFPLDQQFTLTTQTGNGTEVRATSPRVLAK